MEVGTAIFAVVSIIFLIGRRKVGILTHKLGIDE